MLEAEARKPAPGPQADATSPVETFLRSVHESVSRIEGGEVATYIPELGKASPNLLGLAIATIDGKVYLAGDADVPFTIQSVSKPFMYGLALEQWGREAVMKHVGVEPTGAAFNATVFDEDNNRPANPMVNAGAIAVSSMVKGADYLAKRSTMLALLSRYAGRSLSIDESVFRSERETGERNRAIAALMRQAAMLEGDTAEILDVYFSQCSVLVTCRDLALMASTLANGGIQPVTGERVLPQQYVADVLTVMHSCGMYNYAGQWSYEVGVPAKSSVSGAIIGVLPGQMGLVAFSPPLDRVGNSVRAMAAFKSIAREVDMHVFRARTRGGDVIRRELSGETVRSKRRRTRREAEILDEKGRRIRIIEAQGRLNFSSTERLLRRVSEVSTDAGAIILDFGRVHSVDGAAQTLVRSFISQGTQSACRILIASLQASGTLATLHEDVESRDRDEIAIFPDCDAALEWCEDLLLSETGGPGSLTPLSLSQIDLFSGLSREELKPLEHLARPLVFMSGQTILKQGDPAHLLFVIAQGSASVRLRFPGKNGEESIRVAAFGPGATLGEMALLAGGTRSADVVADERVICYGFTIDELRALESSAPRVINTILLNLARELADRVRRANDEIRALKR